LDLQRGRPSSGVCVIQHRLGTLRIGRIDQHGNTSSARQKLTQQRQPLCY
jgi:hypothetical protein